MDVDLVNHHRAWCMQVLSLVFLVANLIAVVAQIVCLQRAQIVLCWHMQPQQIVKKTIFGKSSKNALQQCVATKIILIALKMNSTNLNAFNAKSMECWLVWTSIWKNLIALLNKAMLICWKYCSKYIIWSNKNVVIVIVLMIVSLVIQMVDGDQKQKIHGTAAKTQNLVLAPLRGQKMKILIILMKMRMSR